MAAKFFWPPFLGEGEGRSNFRPTFVAKFGDNGPSNLQD